MSNSSMPTSLNGNLLASNLESEVYELASNETETYTLESFETLYREADEKSRQLYIAVVSCDSGTSNCYDAYSFFLQKYKTNSQATSPLTNLPITDYKVYKATHMENGKIFCTLESKKAEMERDLETYRLPILWNSPKCSGENRLIYMLRFAQKIEKENPGKALAIAEQAADLGSREAKYYLAGYFRRQSDEAKLLSWLEEGLKDDPSPSVNNSLLCAYYLIKNGEHEKAFLHSLCAAEQESFWGILQVLIYLEKRQNNDIDISTAKEWRTKLPIEIRDKSIDEINTYLFLIEYPHAHVGPME